MISAYIYSLGAVMLVSLISFIGIFTLSVNEGVLRRHVFLLVSLAVGALLGDAFLHLIPEAIEAIGDMTAVALMILAGIGAFLVFEKALHWHHHAHSEEHEETVHATGRMILISDGVHNLLDGAIIGGSFLVSAELGIATTLAVILHEIPQEIGDFGILIHAGYTKAKALWFNFLSAFASVAGALLALMLGSASEKVVVWLLPVAAGGFIYVAMSDLVPELHKTKGLGRSLSQLAAAGLGVLVMLLLAVLE